MHLLYAFWHLLILVHWLQAWKVGQAPMDRSTPRYKKDAAAEELPKAIAKPELKLCTLAADGKLCIPQDVRKQYLSCPMHGPEWREVVVAFDKSWGSPVTSSPPPTPSPTSEVKTEVKTEVGESVAQSSYDWSSLFPGAPTTLDKLKEKFGADIVEMPGPSSVTSFALTPGPQLYIIAKDPASMSPRDGALISYCAGGWLTGDKATKFQTNSPGKAVPCVFETDEAAVVLEARLMVKFNIVDCSSGCSSLLGQAVAFKLLQINDIAHLIGLLPVRLRVGRTPRS